MYTERAYNSASWTDLVEHLWLRSLILESRNCHASTINLLKALTSTKSVQEALLYARSVYISRHWFIMNDDTTFVFNFRHARISSTHQPFHFIPGCTWSDQEHSSSFVSIVNEQQMNLTCFNCRSTAIESTRILLAPRVRTAIAESTTAYIY